MPIQLTGINIFPGYITSGLKDEEYLVVRGPEVFVKPYK